MAFDPASLPRRVHYQGYNACKLYTVLRATIPYCCEKKSRTQTNMCAYFYNQISIPLVI